MRTKIILALAASLASFAFAGTTCNQAAGKQVSGLAVYSPDTTTGPTLGKTFEIKWEPTSGYSTVSILLLKGPSTNVVPFSCIANSIPNSGSYSWSVPSSGIDAQSTGYGIQIIADGSGDFQYSTQFGISSGSSGSSNVIAVTSTTKVSGKKVTKTIYHTSSTTTTSCSTSSHSSTHHSSHPSHKIVHTHHSNATHTHAASASSGSVKESVSPTKKPSVPASLANVGGSGHEITGSPTVTEAAPTTTSIASQSATGAASRVVALGGGLIAGLGAVAALAL